MDEKAIPKRIAILSPQAIQDYAQNHDYTSHAWGWPQAENYSDMLDAAIEKAAAEPNAGKRIAGFPLYRAQFVKWSKAKNGHYIIYRPTENGIYVLRILHSAMDIPKHLENK